MQIASKADGIKCILGRFYKKVEVLKEHQQTKIYNQTGCNEQFFMFGFWNVIANGKIYQRTDEHEEEKAIIPPAIKDITRDE